MTDLLGLLHHLRVVATDAGGVRVASSDVAGMAGVVDHDTVTIHISPALGREEWLAALADGLRILAAGRGDPATASSTPVTADGSQVQALRPRLRLAAEPTDA